MFCQKKWRIPYAGDHTHAGFIKDLETDLVLGIYGNDSDDNSQVMLQDVNNQTTFTQKWMRSKPNQDGWFTLQNSGSRNYLAAKSNDELSTSGNITILKMFQMCSKSLGKYLKRVY